MIFFMISKMDLNHTCGATCKDRRKHCYTSNLVKSMFLQDGQGQTSLKSKDIMRKFKYDYDIEMSYYHAYTKKQMALKYINANSSVSYHHLYSYMN